MIMSHYSYDLTHFRGQGISTKIFSLIFGSNEKFGIAFQDKLTFSPLWFKRILLLILRCHMRNLISMDKNCSALNQSQFFVHILGYLNLILLDRNQFRLTLHFLQSVVSYIKRRLENHSQCSSLQSEIAFGQVKQQVKLEDQDIRLTHIPYPNVCSNLNDLIRHRYFSVVQG